MILTHIDSIITEVEQIQKQSNKDIAGNVGKNIGQAAYGTAVLGGRAAKKVGSTIKNTYKKIKSDVNTH